MSLHVLEAGLYSLIVDSGRPHSRSLGVPVGGAADRTSLALGNALVGNPPDAAALEISLVGPTLRAEHDTACVVYGAPFDLHCGLRPLTAGKTFTLHAGEVLRIGGTAEGMRAYLCVCGGLQSPVVLGSRSALAPVRTGDELVCIPSTIGAHYILPEWTWDTDQAVVRDYVQPPHQFLRIVDAPQADWFLGDEFFRMAAHFLVFFEVRPASNRMGLRLAGPQLTMPERELVSEPVCPGAVQVTRDGQCIILGVDGQTIGGYPKIAQVISADLDKLGQLRPGDRFLVWPKTLEEAQRLYRNKMAEVRRWLNRLRIAGC